MIFTKKHASQEGFILAMCDAELLGKVIKSGGKELDLDRYGHFYRGEELTEAEAALLADEPNLCSANLVGKRSVQIFLSKGAVQRSSVMRIGTVPYVQVYKIGK